MTVADCDARGFSATVEVFELSSRKDSVFKIPIIFKEMKHRCDKNKYSADIVYLFINGSANKRHCYKIYIAFFSVYQKTIVTIDEQLRITVIN